MSYEERRMFDWRKTQLEATDDEVFDMPFEVVENYLRKTFGQFSKNKKMYKKMYKRSESTLST